ncbi:MAG: hypothetical protein ACXIVQ_12190 [Acidimicrobiales bacterium]
MTNAEIEATAVEYSALKAAEADAKAKAKPLGDALVAALKDRKVTELAVGAAKVKVREKKSRTYDVALLRKRLARKPTVLCQVLRVSARDLDRAVAAGDVAESVAAEAFAGFETSRPWAEVELTET